ncbi:MAG: undecaprenyldiphospho-muramoylpentapeptide beta-N-acetylglucosaminyltransferase [Alphaproteobacteria bacterium]|nr:undecaprenyldiphospho-muramoylpentapeptide beta-N-acetylglucosaminyltransferase [Alphaproteobacteria bacterium]
MSIPQHSIVLAAGGTGGHIFPAEALAEEVIARGHGVVLITDKRFNKFPSGLLATVPRRTIRAGGSGSGLAHKVSAGLNIAIGTLRSLRILAKLKPRIVVGFGGYPSFPTVYAATMLGIPTLIHEQNSVLGRANRLLAGRVGRIATSFPDTQMVEEADKKKIILTGNPVRGAVRGLREIPYPQLQQDGKLHILITGGSQGASIFSEVMPRAVELLPPHLRARLRIDQQCREAEIKETRMHYAAIGVHPDLATFFVDMPVRLASSHLVIARSGASTVSELAVAGRPAILVPLPTAMDNHQYYNANVFEQIGGGWVMAQDGFTPQAVAARLEAFLTAPETLNRAAENVRKLGMTDAAKALADAVLDTEK